VVGLLASGEHMAAVRADGVAGGDHRMALRTLFGGCLATAVRGDLADTDLVHGPVAQKIATKVEHQAVGLPGVKPRAPADHLHQQTRGHGGAEDRNGIQSGHVHACGQDRAVGQVLQRLTGEEAGPGLAAESRQKLVSLRSGRLRTDEPALDAVFLGEHPGHVPPVLHPGREDQACLPILGMLDDLCAGRLDERVLVHQLFDLAGDEFAGTDVQPADIDADQRVLGDQRREVAGHDQFPQADIAAHVVEQPVGPAQRPAGRPKRGGCGADEAQTGIDHAGLFEERAVHPFPFDGDAMRLVNDHQVERPEFAGAAVDRLDARADDRRGGGPLAHAGAVDPQVEFWAEASDFIRVLFDELGAVGDDQSPSSPPGNGIGGHLGDDPALAGADGEHDAGVAVVLPQISVHGVHSRLLIVPELHSGIPYPVDRRVRRCHLRRSASAHRFVGRCQTPASGRAPESMWVMSRGSHCAAGARMSGTGPSCVRYCQTPTSRLALESRGMIAPTRTVPSDASPAATTHAASAPVSPAISSGSGNSSLLTPRSWAMRSPRRYAIKARSVLA